MNKNSTFSVYLFYQFNLDSKTFNKFSLTIYTFIYMLNHYQIDKMRKFV